MFFWLVCCKVLATVIRKYANSMQVSFSEFTRKTEKITFISAVWCWQASCTSAVMCLVLIGKIHKCDSESCSLCLSFRKVFLLLSDWGEHLTFMSGTSFWKKERKIDKVSFVTRSSKRIFQLPQVRPWWCPAIFILPDFSFSWSPVHLCSFQTPHGWLSDTLCHIMALQLPTVSWNARLSSTGARRCSFTLTTRCLSSRSGPEILMEPCLVRQSARSVHVNTGRLVLHAPWYSRQHHPVDEQRSLQTFYMPGRMFRLRSASRPDGFALNCDVY